MLVSILVLVVIGFVVRLARRASATERQIASLKRDLARLEIVVLDLSRQTRSGQPPSDVSPPVASSPAAVVGPTIPPQPVPRLLPPRVVPASTPSPSAALTVENDDVERAIGERWLLYAGVAVLLLAVVFFLRFAFDHDWLSPTVRVAAGALGGAALTWAGRGLARGGYRNYGLIVAGGGVATLYLSAYAGFQFYGLIAAPAAFGLLIAVSAVSAWIADRESAPALAVVALLGGFATPFLVSSGQDAQVAFFTYIAILIAATTILALRHEWWYLDVLSLGLTIMAVGAWLVTYYTPAKALRTELFLTLYCTMFLIIVRASLGWRRDRARQGARILLLAPVAYHAVSVALLASHRLPFMAYMMLATTAALVIADRASATAVRAVAWPAVAVPLGMWLEVQQFGSVVAPVLCVGGVYAAHLAAQFQGLRGDSWNCRADVALIHANGLGLYAGLVIVLEPNHSNVLAAVAAALAIWNGAVAAAMIRRHAIVALHFAAVSATLLAVAIAEQFEGPWVVVMWAIEASAMIGIASRTNQVWMRGAGWVLMAVAATRWMAPDVQDTAVSALPVLNSRTVPAAMIIALLYGLAKSGQRRGPDADSYGAMDRTVALLGASALTVALISKEIVQYWDIRELRGEVVYVAREAMLSAAWAVYAAAAIAAGIRRDYAPIRYFAIGLFGLTLAKVFAVDLQTLSGIYRVAAFFVIGVVLLFASFLYQRRRRVPDA